MTPEQFDFCARGQTSITDPVWRAAARKVLVDHQSIADAAEYCCVNDRTLQSVVARIRAQHETILAIYGLPPEVVQIQEPAFAVPSHRPAFMQLFR